MSTASTRAQGVAIAREHRNRPDALMRLALRLHKNGDRGLGFEIFRAAPWAIAKVPVAGILSVANRLDSWDSTDCYGCFVSGVAWRQGVLRDAHIEKFARSSDRWMRRAALVSTVPLNSRARGASKPRGDARRTLRICRMLLDDRDDMVVKAMSWALRELAKRDPSSVRSFLRLHDSRLAPRIRREVKNKLTTGLKNPRQARHGLRAPIRVRA